MGVFLEFGQFAREYVSRSAALVTTIPKAFYLPSRGAGI